jgi:hypothetical protein
MSEWVYFLHPPRDNFAESMTEEEQGTLAPINTGISIFEAPDEAAARAVMANDPCVAGGYARGELRPFRVSLLRGRD